MLNRFSQLPERPRSRRSRVTPHRRGAGSDTLCGISYQSINPCGGECLERFEEQSDLQVETAVANATACFEIWKKLSFAARANIASKAAAIMRGRAEELARTVTQEIGKLFVESVGEVMLSADILDCYATNAARSPASERMKLDSGEALVKHSPLGVLFGVQPWNFPYCQLARFAGPNLMAGNVVRVKH